MEKSVRTISRRKFSKLSAFGQHQLLADMARDFLADDADLSGFLTRYAEMHTWVDLDRYQPPNWLQPREALLELENFHQGLRGMPIPYESGITQNLSWKPRLEVEVVLDQVLSPHNIGSILRLIDNFGFRGMVHSTKSLDPNHPRLRRSARGCERWIPIRYEPELTRWLAEHPWPKVAIEADAAAIPVTQWQPPQRCLLVVGNESYGIARAIRDLCDQLVIIPMAGYKKSMNLSHALAVVAQKFVEKGFPLE